ncbi:MAG: hypothetical protein M1820_010720 [Bogoriella megaspora]|nr:MAG: hypothetical protein M1820_010720 [Bogoriella megaspora]
MSIAPASPATAPTGTFAAATLPVELLDGDPDDAEAADPDAAEPVAKPNKLLAADPVMLASLRMLLASDAATLLVAIALANEERPDPEVREASEERSVSALVIDPAIELSPATPAVVDIEDAPDEAGELGTWA